MTNENRDRCPVCQGKRQYPPELPQGDATEVACERCGRFAIAGSAVSEFATRSAENPALGRILCHAVRKMQRPTGRPSIDSALVIHLDETGGLLTPPEQVENLLLWVSDNIPGPGGSVRLQDETHGGIVGTTGPENFVWLAKHLLEEGLLEGKMFLGGGVTVTPSFKGWLRIEQIRRGQGEGRKAFMAMQYGDAKLDEVVRRCFRPAVEATGFYLARLDEKPRAGLIDDRLRVEIRTSRFLIADLTHGNQGAYWEAGFTEGLGKPVIYTCEKSVFEQGRAHCDTNHHLTVLWEMNNLAEAENQLKATIRATLPDEAKLADT